MPSESSVVHSIGSRATDPRQSQLPKHSTLAGWLYSVGLAQINSRNFARLGLTTASAFDSCANLQAMQVVLSECLERSQGSPQLALRRALSCYYSGNPVTGFRDGYVARVAAAAARSDRSAPPPLMARQLIEASK
jgi:type IV secretion system protein VirB1